MQLRMFIRSLIRIFAINRQDTFARCEKYSSKLDISRSLIRIFNQLCCLKILRSLQINILAALK